MEKMKGGMTMVTLLIVVLVAVILILVGGVTLIVSLLPYLLILVGLKIIYNIVKMVVEKDKNEIQ